MTHIWAPKVKILEAELAPSRAAAKGFYTIKKYKVGFKEPVQVVGPFENLITDWGLTRIASGTVGSSYMYVGSGTTPPVVGDTKLGSYIARTDLDNGISTLRDTVGPAYWAQSSITKRFAAGVATGTLTEVGFGTDGSLPPSATYNLFSRALIVDGSGSPVAITVLSDEYLDVTYTIRVYPPLTDATSVINISGTSHTIVTRGLNYPAEVAVQLSAVNYRLGFSGQGLGSVVAYSGTAAGTPPALAAMTEPYMLNLGPQSNLTTSSITTPSTNTVSQVISAGLGEANLSYGIRGLRATISGEGLQYSTQSTVTPAIMKTSSSILTFGMTYSYARHTP